MTGRAQGGEIAGLQYLRGFAALAVVVDHTSGAVARTFPSAGSAGFGFLSYGALGVDLFFLISGFIICVIALEGPALTPTSGIATFAQRRFVRIIPLMWLMIAVYVCARYASSGTIHAGDYLRATFLLPYGELEPNQLWTLRHEAIFYVLFAVSLLGRRRLPWLLAAWIAAPFAYAALVLPDNPPAAAGQFLRILANPVNVEFAAGLVLGIWWHRGGRRFSFSLPAPPLALLALVLGFLAAGWWLGLSSARLPDTLISAALCAPILFIGVHVRCPPGLLHRGAELLGNASYSLYLFHPIFNEVALHALRGRSIALAAAAALIAAIGGGLLVHLFVERPLVEAGRRLFHLHGHKHGKRFLANAGS